MPDDMQDWGLALLLSVQPTDRALDGWLHAGRGGAWLARLARGDDMQQATAVTDA